MKSGSSPVLVLAALFAGVFGCQEVFLDVSNTATGDTADVAAGSTVVVAVVNPVVNAPHNTGVPGEHGDVRDGIDVDPEPGGAAVTADGLAVAEVSVGAVELAVGPAVLDLDVIAAGDVFDAAIAFDGAGAAYFANTPIRCAVGEGSGALRFGADDPPAEIAAALGEDNVVVVLGPGVYAGDLEIRGEGVVVFGEGWRSRQFEEHGAPRLKLSQKTA